MYGGHCGHKYNSCNSLHELETTTLEWKMLAPNDANGAPMKKSSCGVVAHNSDREEQLCFFGGYGQMNSAPHQTTAEYIENTNVPGLGWTNEFHCFTSGEHTQCIVHLLVDNVQSSSGVALH